MGADTGKLSDASHAQIGCLLVVVRPLYHLISQRVTGASARFTPASDVDSNLKIELPFGAYLLSR